MDEHDLSLGEPRGEGKIADGSIHEEDAPPSVERQRRAVLQRALEDDRVARPGPGGDLPRYRLGRMMRLDHVEQLEDQCRDHTRDDDERDEGAPLPLPEPTDRGDAPADE